MGKELNKPFSREMERPHWAFRVSELLTVPFTIHFVLGSPRVDPAYNLSRWRRFKLGVMYRNTKRTWTGISYRAHLAMAVRLLELSPSQPGVVVECGCFRGGTTANLSLICAVVGRELYVYDSFEGLVKAHVQAHGAPEVCTYVKGWFADTTPHHEPSIALLFLDVDCQSSLTDCILNLWPKLVERGYCFTDEYVFNDYCALFWSERFWRTHFDQTPPGLVGSGSGVSLGGFYLGGPFGLSHPHARPESIAYTRKHWSGYWDFYPAEGPGEVSAPGGGWC